MMKEERNVDSWCDLPHSRLDNAPIYPSLLCIKDKREQTLPPYKSPLLHAKSSMKRQLFMTEAPGTRTHTVFENKYWQNAGLFCHATLSQITAITGLDRRAFGILKVVFTSVTSNTAQAHWGPRLLQLSGQRREWMSRSANKLQTGRSLSGMKSWVWLWSKRVFWWVLLFLLTHL